MAIHTEAFGPPINARASRGRGERFERRLGGGRAWEAGPHALYSRRRLLANAVIAAARVASYPCAARRMSPLWPLAHIQKRSCPPHSTAGGDAPIDDYTRLTRLLLDGDQPQALCEPDGRTRLSSADVGSFGDACHR